MVSKMFSPYWHRRRKKESHWNSRAEAYAEGLDALFLKEGGQEEDKVVAKLLKNLFGGRDHSKSLLLDAGCGPGTVTLKLAPHVKHVYGVDISPEMLKYANHAKRVLNLDNVDFYQDDLESFDLIKHLKEDLVDIKENSLGAISCRYVFHHFDEPEIALKNFNRLLKKGRHLLIIDPIVITPELIGDEKAEHTIKEWRAGLMKIEDPYHVKEYDLGDWARMANKSGFKLAEHSHEYRIPFGPENYLPWLQDRRRVIDFIEQLKKGLEIEVRGRNVVKEFFNIHYMEGIKFDFNKPPPLAFDHVLQDFILVKERDLSDREIADYTKE